MNIEKITNINIKTFHLKESTKYFCIVKYVTDTYNQTIEEASEPEDIHIDTYADENEPHQLTKIKLVEQQTANNNHSQDI